MDGGWMYALRLIGQQNLVAGCTGNNTIEQCFGTQDESQYNGTDLYQTWRLWTFQYCTQWGYLTVSPVGHPPDLVEIAR